MSVPPFTRSTRSSNTPKSPPPGSSSSRTARPSSLAVDSLSTRLSSSTQTRRTGLTTSTTSVSTTLPKPRLPTRSSASTAPSVSAPRPLWGSSRQNTDDSARPRTATAPVKHPTGVRRPVTGTGSTRTSLAVPNGSGARAASRAGSVVGRESVAVTPATPVKNEAVDKGGVEKYDPTREPIKAYLRLRPAPSSADQAGQDHIRVLSNTELLMVQPQDHRLGSAASSFSLSTQAHPSAPSDSLAPGQPAPSPQGTLYKFTAIADPTAANAQTAQADFFRATTLPLVNDFVNGENCLLFAYGSTGSGKTWTVQGGEGENAGLLPRTLDVVLRSLQGKHTRANLRPSGHGGVEVGEVSNFGFAQSSKPSAQGLGHRGISNLDNVADRDGVIPVDDSFEYAIWVSHAEIYNEKIFDLLLDLPFGRERIASTTSTASGSTGAGLTSWIKNPFKKVASNNIKRTPLNIKQDQPSPSAASNTSARHISGLREIPIRSAKEIAEILHKGKENRVTYATLSNGESSRSHSVFTIKLLKIPKGLKAAEQAARTTVSRFSVVDLAGSERVVNTGTTGDRLKEAGQINRSLFTLGQCMETLRKNQETKAKGRKDMIPPFRQSKLTDLFQGFFTGDGKAAMIVNVNPHSTSYDENMAVMKFSAVASGVMTIKNNVPVPVTPAPPPAPVRHTVRMSIAEGEEEEEFEYEEEDPVDDDDDERGPDDAFVDALLDELSAMRTALYEAQAQTILAVSAAKLKLIAEYEDKLHQLEVEHQQRRREDQDEMEARFDAKLDIIRKVEEARAEVPLTPGSGYDDSDEEEDEEEDIKEEDESTADEASFAQSEAEVKGMLSPTPAARFAKVKLEDTDDQAGEANQSDVSICASVAGDASIVSISDAGDADGELSIIEHSIESDDDDDNDETAASSRRTTASSAGTVRVSMDEPENDDGDEDDEADDDDPFLVAKPTAGSPEVVKKPKRKLGGKVTDADAIAAAVDGY